MVHLATDERLDRHVAVKLLDPGARRRPRLRRPLHARGPLGRPALGPRHRPGLRPGRRGARRRSWSWSSSLAAPSANCWTNAVRCPPYAGRGGSCAPSSARCARPTMPGSSTGTSSPRTCSSPPTARSSSPTSAWSGPSRNRGPPSNSVVMGTAAYLSPEQISGSDTDGRSDLYSLGVLAYEMLTGVPPFSGDSSVAVAYRRLDTDVAAPLRPVRLRLGGPRPRRAASHASQPRGPLHGRRTDARRARRGGPDRAVPRVRRPRAPPVLLVPGARRRGGLGCR